MGAATLVVLALSVVSTAAQRVYVYEVESNVGITEDVPHVPGISWRFGEQPLVVWVPRDVKPGILLFTNETALVPLYDRLHFLLVVPVEERGGGLWIVDVGSKNGTFVNNVRAEKGVGDSAVSRVCG